MAAERPTVDRYSLAVTTAIAAVTQKKLDAARCEAGSGARGDANYGTGACSIHKAALDTEATALAALVSTTVAANDR